jgi:NADPH-dependent curcumin reductase CurA
MNNRQAILVSRPAGVAQAENFAIREAPVAAPAEGQILVRNEFLSVEPAMRGWIADRGNYSAPVAIGATMRALAVGKILESRHPDYRPGEIVSGWFGWQELATVDAGAVVRRIVESDLPHSLALGVLGINGVTALIGLTLIGDPKPGETVLVSTAAGAVGSAVGQIANILGCRAVGIAGGPDKVGQCLDVFGYGGDRLQDARPRRGDRQGVSRRCQRLFRQHGRNHQRYGLSTPCSRRPRGHLRHSLDPVLGPLADWTAHRTPPPGQARAQGFVILDYMDRWEASVATLADWVRAGKLRYEEDILDGIEACPDALAGLYRGENRGKRLIRL